MQAIGSGEEEDLVLFGVVERACYGAKSQVAGIGIGGGGGEH